MKTVILCGGKGVRYSSDKPKALALIGDKPIIHHLMDIYASQGHNDFILALGWKKEEIINYFMNIKHDFSITFIDTGQNNNTAKRLKIIEEYVIKYNEDINIKINENFFCNYCDGLANVNLNKLQIRHLTHKNIATLTAVRPINQFGVLVCDDNNKVIKLLEKPKMNEYINGGFFIFNKKIFNYININKNQELEKDILSNMALSNELGAYKHDDFWETVNTPKDEIRLNNIYNKCIENNEILDWLKI